MCSNQRCPRCGHPSILMGPDMKTWEAWQRPHWTQVLAGWPSGRHREAIIDCLMWLVVLTTFFSTAMGLLAGLG